MANARGSVLVLLAAALLRIRGWLFFCVCMYAKGMCGNVRYCVYAWGTLDHNGASEQWHYRSWVSHWNLLFWLAVRCRKEHLNIGSQGLVRFAFWCQQLIPISCHFEMQPVWQLPSQIHLLKWRNSWTQQERVQGCIYVWPEEVRIRCLSAAPLFQVKMVESGTKRLWCNLWVFQFLRLHVFSASLVCWIFWAALLLCKQDDFISLCCTNTVVECKCFSAIVTFIFGITQIDSFTMYTDWHRKPSNSLHSNMFLVDFYNAQENLSHKNDWTPCHPLLGQYEWWSSLLKQLIVLFELERMFSNESKYMCNCQCGNWNLQSLR